MKQFDFASLPRVNILSTKCSATIRETVEDFQVEEQLPFEPDGFGGHAWLKIKKRGSNTDWLANELAKFAGVPQVAVGYAGLKDRHAVTTQWFSINLEGYQEPNWSEFESPDIQIIEHTYHGKKLKRGVLAGNYFTLRLGNVQGDHRLWEQSLNKVQCDGVPNYFAEQRFGHQMANLQRADYWFTTGKAPRKRNQKSIYLSAARSWLFNLVLAKRIHAANWNTALAGDVMLLAGTKASYFTIDEIDADIRHRVDQMDIHPTGVMWGRGILQSKADCLQLEQQTLAPWQDWQQGLEKAGLSQERRSLRLFPTDFRWKFLDDNRLELSFFLPAGCYATAVMRELAVISDVSQRNYTESDTATNNNGSAH